MKMTAAIVSASLILVLAAQAADKPGPGVAKTLPPKAGPAATPPPAATPVTPKSADTLSEADAAALDGEPPAAPPAKAGAGKNGAVAAASPAPSASPTVALPPGSGEQKPSTPMEGDVKELQSALKKIEQSIEVTRQKMKEVKDVTFLPDLYFVSAELHIDKSRYLSTLIRLQNPDTPIGEIDFFAAKKAKKEAIEIYQRFIETFPKNDNIDRALFYMAHEYRELGAFEDMVKIHIKLTKDHPKSPFWEESQLILGDFFLEDKKDPRMALDYYQAILARPQNGFMPIARYKTGWCYINMDKFHEALLAFEGVLTIDANVSLDKLPDVYKKTDIKRDALNALVWPYSEEKKLDPFRADTLNYFEKLSPNRAAFVVVLDKLQKRLLIKHQYERVVPIFFQLITLTNDLERKVEHIDDFYVNFRQSKKEWPIENLMDPLTNTLIRARWSPDFDLPMKRKVEINFEIYMRDIATRLQKRAKASKLEVDFNNDIKAYEDYLTVFPRGKHSDELLLDLAESYFLIKKYALAGLYYEQLVQHQQKNVKKSVLDSAIQSYALALKNTDKISKLELAQSREGFRTMGNKFVLAYPKDDASAMVRFNIARTYYDERDFDHAVKYFSAFIVAHPDHKEATTAGNLILDAFNQREDYDGLIRAGKALIANQHLQNQQFKSDVAEIVRQAEYRKVQAVAGDPRNRAYAQTLLSFASKYQGTSLGDQALYEAFNALKAKKDPQAYEPGEQLLEKHGDSRYAKEVVGAMGQMALNTADYRRAANYFEIFARKFPKEQTSKDLIKSAANMRELMGDVKEASEDYRDLGPVYNEDVARQYALSQDWRSLAQTLGARPIRSLRGSYWMGLALYRQNQFNQAKPFLLEASKARATDFEEKKMAAHALYLLASQALIDYQGIQLGGGKNEGELVKVKSAQLQKLEKQLQTVIAFGNGRWTIASLYQLGRANAEFAQFISKAAMPAGLSPEQQAQYKGLISQQADSFKNKAGSYYKTCLDNAEKYEVFTEFVAGCRAQGATDVDEAREEKILAKAGETAPADALGIRKLLFDAPKDPKLLFQLANSYIGSQDYAMARVIVSHILEIKPKYAPAEAQLGIILMYMNDLEGAKEQFKLALTHNGREHLALYGLAGLYKHFGFETKYQGIIKKAHASGPLTGAAHPWMSGI